jgi:hypothetical protein
MNTRLFSRDKEIISGCTLLFILSAIDCVLTLRGLSIKVIEEANPIMQWLIGRSLIGFITLKLLMPLFLVYCCGEYGIVYIILWVTY